MKISKCVSIAVSAAVGCTLCAGLFSLPVHAKNQPVTSNTTYAESTDTTPRLDSDGKLSKDALKYAINGYQWALEHHKVNKPQYLTVVNFNEPSYKKRMFVIDLRTDRVVMAMHVSQARNTGAVYATHFSNEPGSRESSPGIFTTMGSQYSGGHGISLRVNGLEEGINSNALSRAVVIHPAAYMSPSFIKQNGYAGRSWGCFAVNPAHVTKFIHTIEGGSVFFAYAAPEKRDPRVAHDLSSDGEKLYNAILRENSSSLFT